MPTRLPLRPSCSALESVEALSRCLWYEAGHGDQWVTASCVGYRESRWVPTATNGAHWGLYQLSARYWSWLWIKIGGSWDAWSDPVVNTKAAIWIWERNGWWPWRAGDGSCGI